LPARRGRSASRGPGRSQAPTLSAGAQGADPGRAASRNPLGGQGDAPLAPNAATAVLAARAERRPAEELTAREREVLLMVAEGMPNKLIARRLEISERTVKGHLTRIFERLGVTDRTQAALWAERHRLR
jgi:DNA-binding NarL/FixJ family response regulator